MKKNTFSRGLALILCLSMILGFVPGGLFGGSNVVNAVVSEEATNVAMQLRNGSFDILGDNDLPKYWTVSSKNNNIEAVADDRYGGSYSLKFTADGSAASIQQVIPVQSGMKVKLEAWGKQLTAAEGYDPSSKIYIGFKNDQNQWVPDGNNGAVSEPVARTTVWTPSVLEAEIPEGTTKILIEVCHDSNKRMGEDGLSYSYVVDDLVLTLTSKDGDTNLVQNTVFADSFDTYLAGDYGYGPDGWIVGDSDGGPHSAITCNPSYHPGRTIVQFQSKSCDIYSKDFDVVPGCEYTVSFDAYKTADNTNYGYGIIYFKDAAGNGVGSFTYDVAKTVHQWVEETFCVVAPAGAAKAYLKFGITAGGQDFALDNLVVTQSAEPASEPLQFSDKFESSASNNNWTKTSLPIIVWNPGDGGASYGSASDKVLLMQENSSSGRESVISKALPVVGGSIYTLTYDVIDYWNTAYVSYGSQAKLIFCDANGKQVATITRPAASVTGNLVTNWTRKTITARAPANAATVQIYFDIDNAAGNCIYLVDDLILTETPDATPMAWDSLPLNGDFEASTSLLNWKKNYGVGYIIPGEGYNGSNALYVEDSGSSKIMEVESDIFTVASGATYKFSMLIREHAEVMGTAGLPRALIYFLKAGETAIQNNSTCKIITPPALTKDWQLVEAEVEIPDDAVSVIIRLDSWSTPTVYAYIDNITFACTHKDAAYTYNYDATCTANGTESAACPDCGETVTREVVGTEHVQTRIPYNAATPLAIGNIEYYVCSCGNWYEDAACTKLISNHEDVNLPMTDCTNHEADEWVSDNNATCTEDGTKSAKCKHCRTPMQETEVGTKHTQTHNEEIPTSEKAAGTKEHWVCSCGKKYYDEACTSEVASDADLVIERLSCDHVGLQTTYNNDATCTADGTETGHCAICDEDVVVPAPGTKHTQTYVPSTATAAAYYACSCGNNYYDAACTKPANNTSLNFSFEEVNGDSPVNWTDSTTNNVTVVTPAVAPNGKNVLQIAGPRQSTKSLNLSVEAGKTYQMKVMAKDIQGGGTLLDLFVMDAAGNLLAYGRTATDGSGMWKMYNVTVAIPEGADYMYIEFWTTSATDATTWIDNVIIEEVINETDKEEPDKTEPTEPETEPTEPEETEPVVTKPSEIENGNFEEVTEDNKIVGWNELSFAGAAIDVIDEEGNKVVKFVADAEAGFAANIFRTELAVEHGTALTVELMSKLLSGSGDAYVAVFFYDENGVMVPATMTYLVAIATTEDWAETALTLNVPEGAVYAAIEIGNALYQTVSFLVDDVTVTKGEAVEEPEQPETEPVETEPVETEPVETDPVETEPVETEPVTPDEDAIDLNFSFENLGENGLPTAWNIPNAGATINTTDKVNGNNALQIDAVAAAKTVQSYAIPVGKVTDQYEATFRVKRLSGESAIYMGIWFGAVPHKNYDNYCCEAVYAEDDNEWHEYTVSWGVYKDASYMWLEIGNHSGATVSYLIDDITLKINGEVVKTIKIDAPEEPEATEPEATEPEAPTEPTPTEPSVENNLIVNGEFEEGVGNWGGSVNAITSVNTDSHSGDKCMQFTDESKDAAYYVYQKVAVAAGKTYVLSAWVKQVSGPNAGYMGVYGLDNDNVAVTVATTGEWAYYEVEVTIPAGFSEATIEIGAHKSSMTTFLIDQIVFVEK